MDVEASINAAEAQALRELLQVLNHEIMNSLTAIVSLTAAELFSEVPTRETGLMIGEALATIRRRADGLDRFVRGYRDLARLPAPDLQPVDLVELLRETARLFDARWAGRVALELALPPKRIMVRLERGLTEPFGSRCTITAAASRRPNASVFSSLSFPCKASGNGIGLSLAQKIVRGHGAVLVMNKMKSELWNTKFATRIYGVLPALSSSTKDTP